MANAYCDGAFVNSLPGDDAAGNFYMHCSGEWSASDVGPGVSCPSTLITSIPGEYYAPFESYFIVCDQAEFSSIGDPPDDPTGEELPEGFDAAIGAWFFGFGFTVYLAFWALGKTISLIFKAIGGR